MARNHKPIICLNTLEVYESARIICDTFNINGGSLYQACKGLRKVAGKHPETAEPLQWAYLEDYKSGKRKLEVHKPKELKVICLNTEEVFSSVVSAVVHYELGDASGLSAVCKGFTKCYGRHPETHEPLQWAYLDDYKKGLRKYEPYATKFRKVICVNTGEVFESISDAAKKYNLDNSVISHNCRGRNKTGGKHPKTGERLIWQYHEDFMKEKASC